MPSVITGDSLHKIQTGEVQDARLDVQQTCDDITTVCNKPTTNGGNRK